MSVSAELLRDLRITLLRELYRVQPRGRSARSLHGLVQPEIDCALSDVAAQLEFLAGESLAGKLPENELSPGLDPLWRITSAGMKYCEGKHIV
jgi:hypothetical protein